MACDLGHLAGVGRAHTSAAWSSSGRSAATATISACRSAIWPSPPSASAEQLIELAAAERHALSGALDLDEARLAAGRPAQHHDVHVDLGRAVLDVGQVEHRRAADDADADRRGTVRVQRVGLQPPRGDDAAERVVQRDEAAADAAPCGCRRRPAARRSRRRPAARRARSCRTPPAGCARSVAGSRRCGRSACPWPPRGRPARATSRAASSTRPSPSPCRSRASSAARPRRSIAVHSTRVRPNDTRHEPSAISVKSRSNVIGRSSSVSAAVGTGHAGLLVTWGDQVGSVGDRRGAGVGVELGTEQSGAELAERCRCRRSTGSGASRRDRRRGAAGRARRAAAERRTPSRRPS